MAPILTCVFRDSQYFAPPRLVRARELRTGLINPLTVYVAWVIGTFRFPDLPGTIELCGILFQRGTPVVKENSVVEIHVRLLEEGTDCTRPTRGVVLGNGLFELLPTDNYDSDAEHWEFLPGSIVRAKEVRNVDCIYLLAVAPEGS